MLVSLHANLGRRRVKKAEKVEYINALALIYWEEGLRPDFKTKRNGRTCYVNQIVEKLYEVLRGVVSGKTIREYLLPTYKNQVHAEAQKKRAKERQDNTPAYDLILNSFEGVY